MSRAKKLLEKAMSREVLEKQINNEYDVRNYEIDTFLSVINPQQAKKKTKEELAREVINEMNRPICPSCLGEATKLTLNGPIRCTNCSGVGRI